MRQVLVVFASMDPRGSKIGGIETHIRHILRNHPPEVDLVLAGLDEFGDLTLGKPMPLLLGGRAITFLPLAHVPAEDARRSATKLAGSTTLRLVLGGIRHLGTLRAAIAGHPASADIPRVEFAILPMMMGLPFALTVHSDLSKAAKTDSLLKRFRRLKGWSERLAFRAASHVFVVNGTIRDQLVAETPALAGKCDVMNVPVDTRLFAPSPFPPLAPFRLVYAGRFDEVKDPQLMFLAVAALRERLAGALEFHVVGAADPGAFAEFGPIRDITIRHGAQDAEGVARIVKSAHCGIMTSHSEGMPCFLLETLAAGRAFLSVDLPSFTDLVRDGVSGARVARGETRDDTARALAEAGLAIRAAITDGTIVPERLAASVVPYSVAEVFARLFGLHHRLAYGEPAAGTAAPIVAKA
jgi:glycosyltransferase involved in cell wall biosynthesis